MPHQALAGGLIVGGDFVTAHPLPHRLGGAVGCLRLDQAPVNGHHLVGPGLEKADGAVSPYRVLALVAVVLRIFGPQDLLHLQVQPADAGQSVLHPLALGPQLLRVGQVPVGASAAPARIGAVRLHAVRRGGMDLHDLPGAGGLHHPGDAEVHLFPPDGVRHKHHRAAYPGDAQALAGVAVNHRSIDLPFFQWFHGFLSSLNMNRVAGRAARHALRMCIFYNYSSHLSSSWRSCSAQRLRVLLSRPLERRMTSTRRWPSATNRS